MNTTLTEAQVAALRMGFGHPERRVAYRRTFVNGAISDLAISHRTADWFARRGLASKVQSKRQHEGTLVFNQRAAEVYRSYQQKLREKNHKAA